MASHDLQEPLRKIRTFNDRLNLSLQHSHDEDAKKYINRIERAAERMQMLIKDILAFSKISIHKKMPVMIDMNLLFKEILTEYEQDLTDKKATVILDPLPSLAVFPELIRTLFSNLINNALKYHQENRDLLIHIYAKPEEDKEELPENKSNYCRICIEDNGIGFDQAYAEKIFGMFVRLHSASDYNGTGVGLALCKKIAEEHRGHISARSKVNEGAVFMVSLPQSLVPAWRLD
jgi:light-regulated signal transduction histidine kinase (bacteriophytochrome)